MATAKILELDHKVKYIELTDFPKVSISDLKYQTSVQEVIPFRVRFTSINIDGYTKTNPPPIPLQVIGYSNYIL